MSRELLGPNSGFDTLKTELEKKHIGEHMTNQSSNLSWAKYAVLAVGSAIGGYVLWTNRSRIQSFLKVQGASLPSSVAKITSAVAREAKPLNGKLNAGIKDAVSSLT